MTITYYRPAGSEHWRIVRRTGSLIIHERVLLDGLSLAAARRWVRMLRQGGEVRS